MTAVVIGAGGGVGSALIAALTARGMTVLPLGRHTQPALDLTDEESIVAAARTAGEGLRLVIDATGLLHDGPCRPEKSWRDLDPAWLMRNFQINAIGPALLMKHFLPRLASEGPAVFATLSARVGSIGDNRLGGWYGYRASKAALNQMVHTAAIELARVRKEAICVALHPGTVETNLSRPFAKSGLAVRSPAEAALQILAVVDDLHPHQTGSLIDQEGRPIPY